MNNQHDDQRFQTVAGLSHAAIRTRSILESIRYYTEVLGLREAFRMFREDGSLATVYMFLAPGQYLELFSDGTREGIAGPDVIGMCHLCLKTEDIRRSYDMVKSAGGPLDSEIKRGKSQCLMFWTHDPDGTQIEVMEMPPESLQAQADRRMDENSGRASIRRDPPVTGGDGIIESLFEKPCWVIDILPEQVPEDSAGQYFAVEKYYLQPPMLAEIHRRFTDVLLKLNCYSDFRVCFPDSDEAFSNPDPNLLASWIGTEQKDLCILLAGEDVLITINHDDTYMTVYNPSGAVLNRIRQLAGAGGLFFRQVNAGGAFDQ